jgi:hypothetical protein
MRWLASLISRRLIRSTVMHARALAYEYLRFSPIHPFITDIRAWMSLLFMHNETNIIEVFGIELDFCDAATVRD